MIYKFLGILFTVMHFIQFGLVSLYAEPKTDSCKDWKASYPKTYPNCIKNSSVSTCEKINVAKSWQEILNSLKGNHELDSPSTVIKYSFDGSSVNYTIIQIGEYENSPRKYRKGYVKINKHNEIEYRLWGADNDTDPCQGVTRQIECRVDQSSTGPIVNIHFTNQCFLQQFSKDGLDSVTILKSFPRKD